MSIVCVTPSTFPTKTLSVFERNDWKSTWLSPVCNSPVFGDRVGCTGRGGLVGSIFSSKLAQDGGTQEFRVYTPGRGTLSTVQELRDFLSGECTQVAILVCL